VAIAVSSIAAVQALSGSIDNTFVNHQKSVTEEMQGGPSSP
jgi:Flp pilus assembly pilin Flp